MAAIPNSILDDTKKVLGIDSDTTVFDLDITMHINSVFSTLQQLGVGPVEGFEIVDKNNLWTEFIVADKRLNSVRSYVYMKVRQYFDPPATSFALTALEKMVAEAEWRLQVAAESDSIVVPIYPTDPDPELEVFPEFMERRIHD